MGENNMEVPWSGDRCILCLEQNKLTLEHIIPESLGGRLTSRFLCQRCNSTLGNQVENAAKSDPSVRIAVHRLSNKIPDIASRFAEGQQFVGEGEGGQVSGYLREGDFFIFSKELSNGSLIQPNKEARRSVERILKRCGKSELEIQTALQKIDEAPENKKVEVAPGLEIINWKVDRVHPDFSACPLMNPLVPLKIAYEFIALLLKTKIYEICQPLDQIRQTFVTLDPDNMPFRVERLNATDYEPFHGICFEGNNPHASIQIRLFGWLALRVHFLNLSINQPRLAYTLYLDSGDENMKIIENK